MSVYVYIFIYVMCCTKHPIQAAKQTLGQPNEKSTTHPVSGAKWLRAKNGTENKNIAQIGRDLHRAMSKHDPVHAWARTTRALHRHRAVQLRNKNKERKGVCVCCMLFQFMCIMCAVFFGFYFRYVMTAIRPVRSGFYVWLWLCPVLRRKLHEICCGKHSVLRTSPNHSPCTGCPFLPPVDIHIYKLDCTKRHIS